MRFLEAAFVVLIKLLGVEKGLKLVLLVCDKLAET